MAFPYILLAIAIVAALGPGLLNALYAIAIVNNAISVLPTPLAGNALSATATQLGVNPTALAGNAREHAFLTQRAQQAAEAGALAVPPTRQKSKGCPL